MDVKLTLKMPYFCIRNARNTGEDYVHRSLSFHIQGPFQVYQEEDTVFFLFVEDEESFDPALKKALETGRYYYIPKAPKQFWIFSRSNHSEHM
jgi:hypothetical protein